MGLPASQRKILERIENALRGSDPRLASLFSIFTRLTRDEQMPRIEEIRAKAAIFLLRIRYRLVAFGRWFGASDFLRNTETRSTSASAAIAIARRIENRRTSGSALTNRQRMIRNVFTGLYLERSGPSPTCRPIFTQRDARIISSCAASSARCASAV